MIDISLSFDSFIPINSSFFAVSPLIVLGYILFSAFEPEEVEVKKRTKKSDFNLEGHAEE
jgi:hypothetical protein